MEIPCNGSSTFWFEERQPHPGRLEAPFLVDLFSMIVSFNRMSPDKRQKWIKRRKNTHDYHTNPNDSFIVWISSRKILSHIDDSYANVQ